MMTNIKADVFKEIVDHLSNISYGAITITIHNGSITQLDVTKKKRFEQEKPQQVLAKQSKR
ncbi:YezD family protein [Lysinibacillus sp. FSL H8-0500]